MADVAVARGTGAAASPSNSPRLPSPPPLPELQLGPRSPLISATPTEFQLESAAQIDEGASRRIRPGTSSHEMVKGPPFIPLHQVESPFQLQEYLKSYYGKLTRDETSNTVKPISRESAIELTTPPTQQDTGEPVDRNLWLYELCRFLVQRSNRLIVAFFSDSPPCSNQTCPEMRASEWQYLCAVHEPPKSCCAIDYCCHTLDWAGNVLTSPRHFPSRLSLGGDGGNIHASMKQLVNIFRRVYRIFAHAWFQHREVFWSIEQEEGLYKFFKTVCDSYSLIPEDGYTIPVEAEDERHDEEEGTLLSSGPSFSILRDETDIIITSDPPESEDNTTATSTTAATTRRHRHTPSTGTQVTMIAEGAEGEEEGNEGNTTQIQTDSIPTHVKAIDNESADSNTPTDGKGAIGGISGRDFIKGSPRIEMPTDTEVQYPSDPTPTPERHTSDPFGASPQKQVSSPMKPSSTAVPENTESTTTVVAATTDTGKEDTTSHTKEEAQADIIDSEKPAVTAASEVKEQVATEAVEKEHVEEKSGTTTTTANSSSVSTKENDTKSESDDEDMGVISLPEKNSEAEGEGEAKVEEEERKEETIEKDGSS